MNKSCRTLAAAIAVSAFLHGVAHGKDDSRYFFDGIQEEATAQLCGDERFLDIRGFSAEGCKKLVSAHARKCRAIVNKFEADMSTVAQVYLMCLKSEVLLSETGE
jgi:hypothetical protein